MGVHGQSCCGYTEQRTERLPLQQGARSTRFPIRVVSRWYLSRPLSFDLEVKNTNNPLILLMFLPLQLRPSKQTLDLAPVGEADVVWRVATEVVTLKIDAIAGPL